MGWLYAFVDVRLTCFTFHFFYLGVAFWCLLLDQQPLTESNHITAHKNICCFISAFFFQPSLWFSKHKDRLSCFPVPLTKSYQLLCCCSWGSYSRDVLYGLFKRTKGMSNVITQVFELRAQTDTVLSTLCSPDCLSLIARIRCANVGTAKSRMTWCWLSWSCRFQPRTP